MKYLRASIELNFLLFIVCFSTGCNNENNRNKKEGGEMAFVYTPVEYSLSEKQDTNIFMEYLKTQDLQVEFLTENGKVYFKASNLGAELSQWDELPINYDFDITRTLLFYSKDQHRYFVFMPLDYLEEGFAFLAIHITSDKCEISGVFQPKDKEMSDFLKNNVEFWKDDHYTFRILGNRPVLNLVNKKNEVLLHFDDIIREGTKDHPGNKVRDRFDALDKSLPFVDPYNIRKKICIDDDTIDCEIRWREKEVKFIDSDVSSSINPNDFIYFKNDTLNLRIVSYSRPILMDVHYYFTYSSHLGKIVLCKILYYQDHQPYDEDGCEFAETYVEEGLKGVELKYFNEERYTQPGKDFIRSYTLKDLVKLFRQQSGPNGYYFIGCTAMPGQRELFRILNEEPLDKTNIDAYIEIAKEYVNMSKVLKKMDLKNHKHFEACFNIKYLVEHITRVFPDNAMPYLYLGDVCWELGDIETSKVAYNKYVSLVKSQKNEINGVPDYVKDRLH